MLSSLPSVDGIVHDVIHFPDFPLGGLIQASQAFLDDLQGAGHIGLEIIQIALNPSGGGVLRHELQLTLSGFLFHLL